MKNIYDTLYTETVDLDAICGKKGATVEDVVRKAFEERRRFKKELLQARERR